MSQVRRTRAEVVLTLENASLGSDVFCWLSKGSRARDEDQPLMCPSEATHNVSEKMELCWLMWLLRARAAR